jgi:hypothetical protein
MRLLDAPAVSTLSETTCCLCCMQVLQEMLDMLRDHENNHHSARLEWIVIYLIMVEVVVGLLEVLGLFGLVGNH